MYNVFGSGASHGIYAQFMEQTREHNNGKSIGLLRGAGTRMASWFYAMHRLLRLRGALMSTIHQAKFATISLVKTDDRVREAIQDINDPDFWKAIYQLLRAVFPALRALRYTDSSKPSMDKVYMLCHRLTQALNASKEGLNNEHLFPGDIEANLLREMDVLAEEDDEEEEVNGDLDERLEHNSLCVLMCPQQHLSHMLYLIAYIYISDELDEDDLEEPHDPATETLGDAFLRLWKKRELSIVGDFVIAAWALCVMPEVRKDCKERMTGKHRDAIDRVIEKMFSYDPNIDVDQKKDQFWTEFKTFQDQTYPFDKACRWNTADVFQGRSHLWHEKYSDPYTEVMGMVGMRTTSKVTGIGAAERSWGDVKQIKSMKRVHLSARATEMQAVIYTTARITEARLRERAYENALLTTASQMWTDDDVNFDLQLENFGVETTVLQSVSRNRVFRCWEEDWELEAKKKNDPVQEARLLQKYKDLIFYDPDNEVNFTVHPGNMEFQRGRNGGWMAIGIPPDDVGLEEEPFELGDMLIEMIGSTEQADNITMIRRAEGDADADESDEAAEEDEDAVEEEEEDGELC